MDFRVLGPLEVWADGSPVNLGGRQRRLVLAILLANAGQAVSTDRLIEEVWGDSPPDSARKTVQAHLAHLRRPLNGDAGLLSSSGDGYQISPEAGSVDADRFEASVVAARDVQSADLARSVNLFDEALAMFRGEPYAGLADDALTVKVEASRLSELRLNAREERLEALVDLGDAPLVAAEAEKMLSQHPLRERLWAIHMLALYRSGRQSEALRSYSRARQILAEELGIEPSNELRALEQQILEQNASLSDSKQTPSVTPGTVEVRRNPFKGLRAFDEADANDFFGRTELVRRLVERLVARPPASLTVLAGPSGAGKSSVLRAGLIPVLRDRGLIVAVMFPGASPDKALAAARQEALSEMGIDETTDRVDIVAVDQFEELFTQTPAQAADRFIARITDTAADESRWIVTVRADFLGDLLAHPSLGRILQESLVLVPPLEDHEVEAAIVEPVSRVGAEVEPSLVATIVRDVQARASALPLMQYALTDLFERRRGDVLTLDGYQRQGGLSGALVRRADQVYERLSPEGREVARQLFLQLVTIAENDEFARRRVLRENLHADEPALTDEILEQFGGQRLLTFDQDPTSGHATVELAHESLLEVWPRLSRWIDEAREDLLMRSSLNTALAEWEASDRGQSFLLSGGRLAQHESWTANTDLALTETEGYFLSESRRSEDLAQARRRRRRNWIMAGFGAAALVATLFGIAAVQQAQEAGLAADQARENEQLALENEQEAIDALVRASESEDLAATTARLAKVADLAAAANDQLGIDSDLSILLAMEAVEITRRLDGTVIHVAEEALHRAVLSDRLLGRLTHNGEGIAHFSPDGQTFVTSSADMTIAEVWNVEPFEWKTDLAGHTDLVIDSVFDPTGERIATTSTDGTARVWDASTGRSLLVLDPPGFFGPFIPVFSNDGSMLATTHGDGTVSLWDLDTGETIWFERPPQGTLNTLNLEFSPDDTLLLVSREWNENAPETGPLIFDVASGALVGTLEGHALAVWDVGFTPDGSQMLTSSDDGTVKIWDSETREELATFEGHRGPVIDLQISKDGRTVASSGTLDVLVWDLATLQVRAEIVGHTGAVDGIDISSDGKLLLTSSYVDFTTRLWDLTPYWSHELIGLPGPSNLAELRPSEGSTFNGFPAGLAYSLDGRYLAAARGSGLITLWDLRDGTELKTFETGGPVLALAFHGGSELLASAGEAGVAVHDLRNDEPAVVLDTAPASDVLFGPGGLLAADTSRGVRMWDPPFTGQGDLVIPTSDSDVVDLRPDGALLAVGGWLGVNLYQTNGAFAGTLYPQSRPPPGRIHSVAFHHEQDLMVTAGEDSKAVLWSTETLQPIRTLEGHTSDIRDAVFHPSLPELATAGDDGTVKFWNLDTGVQRLSVPAPGEVSDIDYSPDGRYLAAIGEGFVSVYILDVDELVSEAKTRLTRWWTETECLQYLDSGTCPPPPEHLSD